MAAPLIIHASDFNGWMLLILMSLADVGGFYSSKNRSELSELLCRTIYDLEAILIPAEGESTCFLGNELSEKYTVEHSDEIRINPNVGWMPPPVKTNLGTP